MFDNFGTMSSESSSNLVSEMSSRARGGFERLEDVVFFMRQLTCCVSFFMMSSWDLMMASFSMFCT